MTSREDELTALRRRAYGPDADIDAEALARLRNLEDEGRLARVPEPPVSPLATVVVADDSDPGPEPEPRPRWTTQALERLARVRRSTWLIVVGVAVVAAVLATVLTVVQRVQVHPLQAGAQQVARLSLDTGADLPPFLSSLAGEENSLTMYSTFHGLRATMTSAFFPGAPGEGCLSVFSEQDMADSTSQGFSGQMMWGCSAGGFPALVQFRSDVEGFPAELAEAFPAATGLQFVYDPETDEVVVFAITP